MNRTELLRYLQRKGCRLVREGDGIHGGANERNDRRTAVPRHREIHDLLAGKICRDLGVDPIK